MNIVSSLLGTLVGFAIFLGPAAVVGAVTAGLVRASATRRQLSPADIHRKARAGFWIGAVICVAVEFLLIGWCVAAVSGTS